MWKTGSSIGSGTVVPFYYGQPICLKIVAILWEMAFGNREH